MNLKKFGKELSQHFMTGVSFMIPIVTAAGLLTSFGIIIGGQAAWDQDTGTIAGAMVKLGATGLGLIIPIIAAYISYSISDKPGLAPAFIVGSVGVTMNVGFLGGMLIGIMTGYLVQWLKKLPLPALLQSLKTILIIPFFGTFTIGFILIYVIGEPISWLNTSLTNWLNGLQGGNAVVLAIIIGAMMAFDMGGPINKVANTFGLAAFASGVYGPSTAMLTAIAIPPLGLALATLIGKKYYDESERQNGVSAIVMGFCGITEGAIPFAVKDPISVIPGNILGTVVTTGLVAAFGITSQAALATIMMLPFTTNPLIYALCVAAGVVTTALTINSIKAYRYNRKMKKETAVD